MCVAPFIDSVSPISLIFWLILGAAQISNVESVPFAALPELVNRFLMPSDPVVIHYTVNPSMPPPERAMAWDVEVKMEDVAMKAKMTGVMLGMTREASREILKLDDEVCSRLRFSCHLRL